VNQKFDRKFYGSVVATQELVRIYDYRDVPDNSNFTRNRQDCNRSDVSKEKPCCRTNDDRVVRVKDDEFEYVNYNDLEGEWEIQDDFAWTPIEVSLTLMDE